MLQAQATAHVNRILHSRGIKGTTLSVNKLKSMGFKPLMELPQGVFWQLSDLEKAAELAMKELQQQKEAVKTVEVKKMGAPKVRDRLQNIELMLTRICQELNIKE